MVEEFAANGTSGLFQLRHGDLYLNSEQVVVLTRDRNGDSSLLDSQLTGQPGGQGETPAVAPGADLLGEHSGSARRVEFATKART